MRKRSMVFVALLGIALVAFALVRELSRDKVPPPEQTEQTSNDKANTAAPEAQTPSRTLESLSAGVALRREAAIAKMFMHEGLEMHLLELDTEALAVWRAHASLRPTLILLSNEPMLLPAPMELWPEVTKLVSSASQADIGRRSTIQCANPVLLPGMAVDSALRLGWIGQLIWAIPLPNPDQPLVAETFRQQLLEAGLASQEEVASLAISEHQVNGTLRGVPLRAAALKHMGGVTGPVIVHIDQSYFAQMYKNEIKTPLFSQIVETLTVLRDLNLPTLAVTFSHGNLEGRIALDVRFIGEVVEALVEHPETLGKQVPLKWRQKSEALYAENFFQKERILELDLAMEKKNPNSAWVKFDLYRSATNQKQGDKALSYLAEAVMLDRMYALEYLELANMAYEKGRPDEAMRMLRLASEVFPEFAQIRLQMAHLAQEMGDRKAARQLVEQLQHLQWSPIYYPDMPGHLNGFAATLRQETDTSSAEVKK